MAGCFSMLLGSQHGAQLLLAAGQERLILLKATKAILMVGDNVRRRLGDKLLIPQLPAESADFLLLLFLLFHNPVERFLEVDVTGYDESNGQPFCHQPKAFRVR